MIMEKKILTEINRYRELMNLFIISEGRGDLINDIVSTAKRVFTSASPGSAEDIYKRNLINATTESELVRVLRSEPRLARKVIRKSIIDSGDQFFIDVESRIVYFINEGKDASFIKDRVKFYFDKHVTGVLKDDVLETYYPSIDRLHSGRNTPKQIFGRDVVPYTPKPKPKPKNIDVLKYFNIFKGKLIKKIIPNYQEVSERVISNLKKLKTEQDGLVRASIEKQIKKDMDTLYGFKKSYLEGIDKHIQGMLDSTDKTVRSEYTKIKNNLDRIKKERGEWGYTASLIPGSNEWRLLKQSIYYALTLERNILKAVGNFAKPITTLVRKVRNAWMNNAESTEKIKEFSNKGEGFKKYAFFGSPRGLPPKKINLNSPTAYEEILKYSGVWGARRSYVYEIIIRACKLQIYYAFLKTIKNFITNEFYSEELLKNPCTKLVMDYMVQNNIKTAEKYLEAATSDIGILPPCLVELIVKKDNETVASIMSLAEFRLLPDRGNKIISSLIENLKKVELKDLPSRFIPIATWYTTGAEIVSPFVSLLQTGDATQYDKLINDIQSDINALNSEIPKTDSTTFTGDVKGFKEYLSKMTPPKTYKEGSFQEKTDVDPAEGEDTGNKIYYYKDGKWK